MKYIVWRKPFKSYDYPQGDGYFVKYKNKCADEWSPNWFDAGKYNNIGNAITRLGLKLNDSVKSIDDFLKVNDISKSYNREKSISDILGENPDSVLFFEKGHIDKIDENGNFCGNAGNEIIEYVENFIKKNIQQHTSIKKKLESLGVGNYIDNSISDEDFWIEVLKK